MNTHVRDNLSAQLGLQWFYVPGMAIAPELAAPCGAPSVSTLTSGQPQLAGPSFSGSVDQAAQFQIALPKRWNAGTFTYRVRWNTPAANTAAGTVGFFMQAAAASDGDSADIAFGTGVAVVDTFLGAKKHHITPLSTAVTIAGTPAKEDNIYFRLVRTPSTDTKTDAVTVEGVEIFITLDNVNDA